MHSSFWMFASEGLMRSKVSGMRKEAHRHLPEARFDEEQEVEELDEEADAIEFVEDDDG